MNINDLPTTVLVAAANELSKLIDNEQQERPVKLLAMFNELCREIAQHGTLSELVICPRNWL